MISNELKARVNSKLRELIVIAEKRFNRKFNMPTVRYDITGETRAGWAKASQNLINLNAELMLRNVEETINNTVPHEFAHIVDAIVNPDTRSREIVWTRRGPRRAKRSIHGPSWKSIMYLFGCDAERCFQYDTFGIERRERTVKSGTIVVKCSCGCGKKGPMGAKRAAKWRANPSSFWFHRGYALIEVGAEPVVAPKPVVKPAVELVRAVANFAPVPSTNGLSKQQIATTLVRSNPQFDRKVMIDMIMTTTGTSKAGANTMYYNARKSLGL
jgi:SprT protein